jgi:ABC-type glycerol-3-phosphate transport system substrate-binding protein
MRTKLLWLLVVLSILLSACGGNTPTPEAASTSAPGAQPTPAANQTTVLFAANEYEMASYNDLIKAFEKDNPALRKTISSNGSWVGPLDTQRPTMPTRACSGAEGQRDAGNLGDRQGDPRPKPFIDADTTFKGDDFIPARWSGSSGKAWCAYLAGSIHHL